MNQRTGGSVIRTGDCRGIAVSRRMRSSPGIRDNWMRRRRWCAYLAGQRAVWRGCSYPELCTKCLCASTCDPVRSPRPDPERHRRSRRVVEAQVLLSGKRRSRRSGPFRSVCHPGLACLHMVSRPVAVRRRKDTLYTPVAEVHDKDVSDGIRVRLRLVRPNHHSCRSRADKRGYFSTFVIFLLGRPIKG